MTDQEYMRRAIGLAGKGEGWTSPNPLVGAVIVKHGAIIGEGFHGRCGGLHAEREAIASLTEPADGATLYVTLEPCPMCAGALLQCRMDEVVIGCMSPKSGCAGSVLNLLEADGFNHKVRVRTGVLEEECAELMTRFFRELRARLKKEKIDKAGIR